MLHIKKMRDKYVTPEFDARIWFGAEYKAGTQIVLNTGDILYIITDNEYHYHPNMQSTGDEYE